MNIFQDRELRGNSIHFKNWMSRLTLTTCRDCVKKHGTIFPYDVDAKRYVPMHDNGQCEIVPMRTKRVGTATEDGVLGADVFLVYDKSLPDNYISVAEAKKLGWIASKGNLSVVAPGKMLYDEHANRLGKLPDASGRIWYEADINYKGGYRQTDRILFSNDGLIFVSYDHYKTYYEITR